MLIRSFVGVFMRILDKTGEDATYISIRKRLTRSFMLKIEVVVTLIIMMTMMLMMAVQSRDEHPNDPRDQRASDQDYSDYEEHDVSDYDEDYLAGSSIYYT